MFLDAFAWPPISSSRARPTSFSISAIKGSRTVFTNHAPFINVPFLTEPPQTLYVFDYRGKKMDAERSGIPEMAGNAQGTDVEATSIAYSAGGIWPCIVGTALLVIGSMVLALVIGISSAIYLSEYSRDTPLYSPHSHRHS